MQSVHSLREIRFFRPQDIRTFLAFYLLKIQTFPSTSTMGHPVDIKIRYKTEKLEFNLK